MDVLTSSEFRKRYASLLRPTVVTANGHAIGVWEPHKGPVPNRVERAIREFCPVPKPGKRR